MNNDSAEFNAAVKEATREAVNEVLITLGIDTKKPLELQADMLYVRRSRETTQQVGGVIRKSLIGLAVTGVVSVAVMVIKEAFKQ
jgi:hypothetical protein